jgi:hypothetical protein
MNNKRKKKETLPSGGQNICGKLTFYIYRVLNEDLSVIFNSIGSVFI